MKTNMHYGAHGNLFAHARTLRAHQTVAEKILWDELRGKQLGVKFRRQHPVLRYVVDFYCHELKFIIEVDGSIHNDPTNQIEDREKDNNLIMLGYKVIRFTNDQIINHIDQVKLILKTFITCLKTTEEYI